MSAPAIKRHCYDEAAEAELQRWPGVTVRREVRGKHYALVLTFGGLSRFVTYPTSPGDVIRGPKNHVRDIRATLREIGAKRDTEPKAPRQVRRKRNPTQPALRLVRTEPETGRSPDRDPFAALANLKLAEPAPEPIVIPLWKRVINAVREFFA